ncbi:hypothetical protein IWX50DRAFT_45789 [Phyllosticta citricarpa]|uniref:IBR domain-containing protein n=2 Tax=Phyllosticta TaxID=121621 RepID=A0ABR1MPH8_9PEZI
MTNFKRCSCELAIRRQGDGALDDFGFHYSNKSDQHCLLGTKQGSHHLKASARRIRRRAQFDTPVSLLPLPSHCTVSSSSSHSSQSSPPVFSSIPNNPMSPPMEPPDDPRAAPSQSPGFWSQDHLHVRRQQEQSLYLSLTHHHRDIKQERSSSPHREYHYGRPIYQQQPRTMTPNAMSPIPLRPKLYSEPYIHPSRIGWVGVPAPSSRAGQPEDPTAGLTTMPITQLRVQPYSSPYLDPTRATRDQTDWALAYYQQSYPRMGSETTSSGQGMEEPYREPYPQPVGSIESEEMRQPSVTGTTSETSWSETERRLRSGNTVPPEAVTVPKFPDVDICDEDLPVEVRLRALRNFKSAMDKAQNKWVEDGRPPCPNNCRADHPPPCRSRKEFKQFRKIIEAGHWLESLNGGKPPCLRCGLIHKGHCTAPQCVVCKAYHKEMFSCDTARKKIRIAEEMNRELRQRQQEKDRKQGKQQQRRQQRQQLQQKNLHREPHPLPMKPMANEQDFIASAFRGMLEARLSGISDKKEKNRVTRIFLDDFAQSLKSKRKRDEEEDGEQKAVLPLKLRKLE